MVDLPTGLDQVDCPVVLAQGTLDAIPGGQTPRYLLGCARVEVPAAGRCHSPMADTPDAVVRLVHEAVALSRG